MKPDILNYFHDWVSARLSFSEDIVLRLEVMTEDEEVHSATITFVGFRTLEFKDYQQPIKTETEDLETVIKLANDRWLQRATEIKDGIEIEFIGGNDFTESHVGTLSFKYNFMKVSIDNEECLTERDIERVLNQIEKE